MQHKLLGVCVTLMLFSGCATLSKEECATGNWEAIGFADGAAGYTGQRISEHNKACAKMGIAPDYQAWRKGREAGLQQYCTESNAYAIGRRGGRLSAVCPSSLSAKLNQKYQQGHQYYTMTTELKNEKDKLAKYQEQYDKLRSGDNLDFATEREARTYLVQLTTKISDTKKSIQALESKLSGY